MAELWKVHPFREGNTRTTITFCCDFADSRGFCIDRDLFKKNSIYFRKALVAASAKFSDLGDLSKPEYLIQIIKDGIQRGEELSPISSMEKSEGTRRTSSKKVKKPLNKKLSNEDYYPTP